MSKERLEKAKELVESYEMEFLSNHPIFLDEDIETLIWMLEQAKRAQELEKENTGLKQDLKCVSEQLESVTDVVWEGEE